MRDYQRKNNNPYYLPKTLYRRVLSVIRDYSRQRQEVNNIIYGSSNKDVAVSGGAVGSPIESMVIRLEKYTADIEAVEKAMEEIPPEYQRGVFENIVDGKRFPDIASYKTWLRQKQKFVWRVAKELKLV